MAHIAPFDGTIDGHSSNVAVKKKWMVGEELCGYGDFILIRLTSFFKIPKFLYRIYLLVATSGTYILAIWWFSLNSNHTLSHGIHLVTYVIKYGRYLFDQNTNKIYQQLVETHRNVDTVRWCLSCTFCEHLNTLPSWAAYCMFFQYYLKQQNKYSNCRKVPSISNLAHTSTVLHPSVYV